MTRQRNDEHSTEFGLWLRVEKELDSSLGYTASNIDYVWQNWHTKDWVFIEEKRYNSTLTYSQTKLFTLLHQSVKDANYKGFYILTFEKTSPEDGEIFIERLGCEKIKITKDQLLNFLKFKNMEGNK